MVQLFNNAYDLLSKVWTRSCDIICSSPDFALDKNWGLATYLFYQKELLKEFLQSNKQFYCK